MAGAGGLVLLVADVDDASNGNTQPPRSALLEDWDGILWFLGGLARDKVERKSSTSVRGSSHHAGLEWITSSRRPTISIVDMPVSCVDGKIILCNADGGKQKKISRFRLARLAKRRVPSVVHRGLSRRMPFGAGLRRRALGIMMLIRSELKKRRIFHRDEQSADAVVSPRRTQPGSQPTISQWCWFWLVRKREQLSS